MRCQLKASVILLSYLFFLSSCSLFSKKDKEHLKDIDAPFSTVSTEPKWFNLENRFHHFDDEGKTKVHLFFDTEPHINFQDKTLYFVVTTHAGSEASYDMDLVSGHLYRKYHLCEQRDVWEKFSHTIYKPPFTEGVIPQMLDQLGKPQKILVFGNENYYREFEMKASHQVRVVGGLIEQLCHQGNCLGKNNWDSHMVLIAVDPHDQEFSEIKTIDDLKDKIDWDYFLAYLQNGQGRNRNGGNFSPAVRVTGEIKPSFALKFVTSFSHVFDELELKKVQSACVKLYDHIWNSFGKIMPHEKEAETLDDLKKVIKDKEANLKTFASEFKVFYKKYAKEYQTCTDFVQTSSIEDDSVKHWFFTQLTGYFKLQRLGHLFKCSAKSWGENPYKADSYKRETDPQDELLLCAEEDIDISFSQIPVYMTTLKNSGREYYRYIDYDNTYLGTHQKIFSWVNVSGKELYCRDQKIDADNLSKIVFPDDIRWINRSQINAKKKFGIIY